MPGGLAAEVVGALALRERGPVADRPRVVAAMIASLDGRAAVEGRSVGLGHPEDRALLRGLRDGSDAVLVGAATVRAERYAKLFDGDDRPLIAVASRSGDVPWEVGMFAEPDTRVAVYTEAEVAVPGHVVAAAEVRALADPVAVLTDLRARDGAELVLCEGGPTLLRSLVAAGLLDDLVLTVAPLLVGGDAPAPLAGAALEPPARLALAGQWRADDHLFLHYTA